MTFFGPSQRERTELLPVVIECYLDDGTIIDVAERLPPTQPSIAENLHLLGIEACRRDRATRGVPRVLTYRPYGVPSLSGFFTKAARAIQEAFAHDGGWVVIDYAHEGYTEWMSERLREALVEIDYEVDPHRLVLLTGDVDGPSREQPAATDVGAKGFRVLFVNYFGALVASQDPWRASPSAPRFAAGSFATLCLNRRVRLHRVAVAAEIVRLRLNSAVSLPQVFEDRTIWDVLECDGSRLGLAPTTRLELVDWAATLDPVLPLVVDTADVERNHAYSLDAALYLGADVTIVTESLFFECHGRHRFLSEKVFRPLAVGRPFFVVGSAGTLAALAQLGFRTFSAAWNESYDAVAEPDGRLKEVLRSICETLTPSSWAVRDVDAITEAVAHNRAQMEDPATFHAWTRGLSELLAGRDGRDLHGVECGL